MAKNLDIAKVCLNGHVLTYHLSECPDVGDYCTKCGAEAIDHWPKCNAPIKGLPFDVGYFSFGPGPQMYGEAYCHECGKPYPWAGKVLAVKKDRIIRLTSVAYWFRVLKKKVLAISVRLRRLVKPPWARGEILQIVGIIAAIVVPVVIFLIR